MWKQTIIAITALAALTAGATARPSHHNNGNEAAAAIGGLITGVVLSEFIDDTNINVQLAGRYSDGWDRYHSDYRDYDRYRNNRYYDGRDYRQHSKGGHYIYEKRRIWVPGHWEYTRDRRGYKVKIWVKGRHEIRRVKVWVNDRHHSRDRYYNRDRYDRGGSYCR